MKAYIVKKIRVAGTFLFLLFFCTQAMGQAEGDYRTVGTGALTWSTVANWEIYTSGSWSAATVYPGQDANAKIVNILDGAVVTLDVSPANAIGALTFAASSSATSLTVSGFILNVTGDVNFGVPTANGGDQTLTIGTGTLNCASLIMPDTGNDNYDLLLTISTGTITATGSITMSGTTARNALTFSGAGTINVGGNFTGTGVFTCSTGTINYNGSAAQNVGGFTYYNLTFTNSSTKTLQANSTAGGALTVNSGATFDLGTTATTFSVTGTSTISGTFDFGITSTKTVDFGGNLSGAGTIDMSGGSLLHTLNLSGATNAIGTLSTAAVASTINYDRTTAQTVFASLNYRNLTISGGSSSVKTLQGDASINNNLSIATGTTFNLGTTATSINISGDATFTGGLNFGTTTTKTFSVTGNISGAGTIDMSTSSNNIFNLAGNNTTSGTFTAGTGTFNYNGAGQTVRVTTYNNLILSGSGTKTLSNATPLTINGTLDVTGSTMAFRSSTALQTVTVAGNLSGIGGTIDMSPGAYAHVLNLGGETNSIGTLTTDTDGTVVNYNRSGNQSVFASTSYRNLTLSGSGTKTASGNITFAATLTNSEIFDMSTYTLTLGSTTTNTGGTIRFSGATNGLAINSGTIDYYGTGQTVASGSYVNLTLSNASGTNTAGGNLTVSGILTTTAGGTLDMGTDYNLSGTLTTITNNGTIKTSVPTATSATPIPASKTWGGTIEYGALTGLQTVVGGTYNNLTLDNTSGTNTAGNNLTVNGTLTTAAGGTLDMGTTRTLLGTLSTIANSGTIKTSVPTATSATPIPTGKTWTGTVEFGAAAGLQTIVSGTYNNLTLDNTSGANSAGGELTVDGTLTTTSGGTLDMGTANILSGTLNTISNGGTIKTSVPTATSATPLPSGKTWNGTVQYGATTGLQTIVSGTYGNLTLSNTSNSNTAGGDLVVNGTLTTSAGGTMDLGTDYTLSGTLTTITNGGTIKTSVPTATSSTPLPSGKTWTGTVQYGAASGLQTIVAGTYNNLTLSNTSAANAAGGDLTVNGTLTTTAGGTMDMGTDYVLSGTLSTITNNGSIKTSVPTSTSATPIPSGKTWTGTIQYGAASGLQTIVAGTYNNLTISNTSGTNSAGGNLTINGTLTTSAGGTLDMGTNVFSTLTTVANSGTIKTSNTSGTPLPTGKTWGGTIEYATLTGSQTVVAGTYNNLTLDNTSGTNTAGGNLTVNGTITTETGGTLDMGTNRTLTGTLSTIANSGTIKTSVPTATSSAPIPSGKTWTGTIQYGAATGAQTIVSGTYNNLTLSNTSGSNSAGGVLTISGDYTSSSGGTLATSNNVNFNGSVFCGGSINASAGTVTYGASATNILAGTYYDLIIPDNATLCGNLTVNGAITMGVNLNYNGYTIAGLLVVSSVSATNANGAYKTGQTIYVTVEFSKNIIVTGVPQLTLETGGVDHVIDWDAGVITNTLTFPYVIQSGDYNADLDYISTDALSLNGGTIKDASNNNANITLPDPGAANSLGANKDIKADGIVPTLTYVHIQSNNSTNSLAKVGNEVTLTFAGSEVLAATPTVSIATRTLGVNVTTGDGGTTWTATYTMASGDAEGNVPFTIDFTDIAGNPGTQITSVTDLSSVTFDQTLPTLTSVHIESNNSVNIAYAKVGHEITLTFTASEVLKTSSLNVTIAGQSGVPATSGDGINWEAKYTMVTGYAPGNISFVIGFKDLADNQGVNVSTVSDGSSVKFDELEPTVTISSNKTHTNNNPIILTITFIEDVANFADEDVNVSNGTKGAFTVITSSQVWTLEVTPTGGGIIQCSIPAAACTDLAGNSNEASNTVFVTYDIALPTLPTVTISSNNTAHTDYVGVGGLVTISMTASESIVVDSVKICNDKDAIPSGSEVSWSAKYTMLGTEPEGIVNFWIYYHDSAGNIGAVVSSITEGTNVTFISTLPNLIARSIVSSNAIPSKAMVGDLITVTYTADRKIEKDLTAEIKGKTATITRLDESYTLWKATYTMSSADSDIPSNVDFELKNYKDYAGNVGDPVSTTTDATSVTFDKTKPTLSGVSITSDNAMPSKATTGSKVTVTFTANEAIQILPSVTILSQAALVSNISGNQWKGEYTLTGSEPEGQVAFLISYTDEVGNIGNVVSTTSDGSRVAVDKTQPFLTSIGIASNNANNSMAVIGNTVTLSFTANEPIKKPDNIIIAGNSIDASDIVNIGDYKNWKATYLLVGGEPIGLMTFSISYMDSVSISGTAATNTTNGSSVTLDPEEPRLDAVSISSNNANPSMAKTGNLITVNFTSSEVIENVTATILGQAAAVTKLSTVNWKATYSPLGGEIQGNVGFVINFKDLAGNSGICNAVTDGSSVYYDETPPALNTITIASDYTIHTNMAKVGSLVTVEFESNETIENITATIKGRNASVVNPSGNIWNAFIYMSSSDTEGNVGFTINYKDMAGNSGDEKTSTTNGTAVTFDKTKPDFTLVDIQSDNALSNSQAKVGNIVTLTFNTSEEIEIPAVNLNGHELSATDIGSGSSWKATWTMASTGDNEGVIPFTIDIVDKAGNVQLTRTTTNNGSSVTFDKTIPGITECKVPSGVYKVDSTVTVFIQADNLNYEGTTVEVNGKAQTLKNNNNNTYSISYKVAENDNQHTNSATLPVNIVFRDAAGNTTLKTEATVYGGDGKITIDTHTPQITSVTSNGQIPGILKIGDMLTFTVTPSVAETGLIITPTTYNGKNITWTTAIGVTYTATYTVAEGDATQESEIQLPAKVVISDVAGNVGDSVAYNGVLKTIYATKPTAAIFGTTTECYDAALSVPITFHLTGYPPFEQLIYKVGTRPNDTLTVSDLADVETEVVVNITGLGVGTHNVVLVNLTDSTGNFTTTETQKAVITVNALPNPTLNIEGSPFNVNSARVPLIGYTNYESEYGSTGTYSFLGEGVSANGYFYPEMIDVSLGDQTVRITYTYNDINGCTKSVYNDVVVSEGGASLSGVEDIYCNYDAADIITVDGLDPGVVGTFTVNAAQGWSNSGTNELTINPAQIDPGDYQIIFNYEIEGTLFNTKGNFTIDAATVEDFVTLEAQYCNDINGVELNALNPLPGGGTGHFEFSGPSAGFLTASGSTSAQFFPKLTPAGTYQISFYYTSPSGCNSNEIEKSVTVRSIPSVNIVVKDNYNKDIEKYELECTPAYEIGKSTFSNDFGAGISGKFLYPGQIPVGNLKIRYTYKNEFNCSNYVEKDTRILQATEIISGLDNMYCYSTDTIEIECVSSIDPTIVGEFVSDNGVIVPTAESNKARYPIASVGNGEDVVRFRYTYEGTPYEVFTNVLVDSIGKVWISGYEDLDICEDATQIQLFGHDNHIQGGGVFTYTGSTEAFNNSSIPTLLYPTQENVGTYSINYEYTSSLKTAYATSNCKSDTTIEITIHSLPEVDFDLYTFYNIEDPAFDLVGEPAGGIFSGSGVVGSQFKPLEAGGVGAKSITYSFTDVYGCDNSITKTITLIGPSATIDGIPTLGFVCLDGEPIELTGSSTNGNPGYFEGNGITNTEPNKATFDPAVAGVGDHTIFYKYTSNADGITLLYISEIIKIEEPAAIQIIGVNEKYCKDDPAHQVNVLPGGGVFSGSTNFMVGNQLYPNLAEVGLNTLTYTYTSSASECSTSSSVNFTINPLPVVHISAIQTCSDLTTDSVQFVNSTESDDEIATWNWLFETGGYSDKFEPKYLFKSAGSKYVTLTATTVNGCDAFGTTTFTVGILPKANFTWINECLTGEETVFTSTSDGGVDIENFHWIFNEVESFEGVDLETLNYPFPSVGDFNVKLVVTSEDGCQDSITKVISIQPLIAISELTDQTYFEDFEDGASFWSSKPMEENKPFSWTFGTPAGTDINQSASGVNSWFTVIDSVDQVDHSQMLSPCFDLRDVKKPMLKFNMWSSPEAGRNGTVLQYTTDNGVKWENLGDFNTGINWFNSNSIRSQPGYQLIGWSTPTNQWVSARHSLDDVLYNENIRFRIVFRTDGTAGVPFDGFAFDDFWIGNREQKLLTEYFTNTSLATTDQPNPNADIRKIETDFWRDLVAIHYHTSSPSGDPFYALYPSGPSSRQFFYGVSSIPYALVNGDDNNPFGSTNLSSIKTLLNIEMLKDPKMSIEVDGSVSSTLNIEATVKMMEAFTDEDLVVHCAVVQKIVEVSEPINGVDKFYSVLRTFLPDPGGTQLKSSWEAGETGTFNFTWSIPTDVNTDMLRVVVFVQNIETGTIYQTGYFDASPATSTNPQPENVSVLVFPNPATSIVRLLSPQIIEQASLVDITGRILKVYNPNEFQFDVPVQHLVNGIYFVNLKLRNGQTVVKFVKE